MNISDSDMAILAEVARDLRSPDYVECSIIPGVTIASGYTQSRATRERAAKRIDEILAHVSSKQSRA